MLKEIGEWIKATLESKFNHIEYYEGQFEQFDKIVVNPPAAYINYGDIENGQVYDPLGTIYLTLHMIGSKLYRGPGNMLDLVEDVVGLVHDKAVRYNTTGETTPPTFYVGRCFFNRIRNNTTFPGLIVWDVELRIERT